MIIARCTLCGYEVESNQPDLTCCPGCGTRFPPADPAADVTVRVNWDELQGVLRSVEWLMTQTDNLDGLRFIHALARRLEAQHPDRPHLTAAAHNPLMQELLGTPRPAPAGPLDTQSALAEAEAILKRKNQTEEE